ncbi:MAG: bacterioferritin [Myxococcales bacterium]|nr:bacterioferritin [Myxococcales bacterium]
MKGDAKLIDTLNELLAEELTAINQYMLHAEILENWGYTKLYAKVREFGIVEMKHAERLMGRILFLEGLPNVSKLNPMRIGKTVEEMVLSDYDAEVAAVKSYNEAIAQAVSVGDNGTRDLLTEILKDEEGHIDWAEEQRDQIQQMGLQNYLANQV